MPFAKYNSLPTSLDLSNFYRLASVIYFLATLVLCCALISSYFTLKRILVEQNALNSLQNSTGELWSAIQDSSVYLIDLKEAKNEEQGESLLIEKISRRLESSLESIYSAKENTQSNLLAIEKYPYSQNFYHRFNSQPYSIWLKLDLYIARLEAISRNGDKTEADIESLWLPVEATAAKSGTLGKNYAIALEELNGIILAKSVELRETHLSLTQLSVGIALLELLLIFIPLQRYLSKSTRRLHSAHRKLDALAHFDEETKLYNLPGMARLLSSWGEQSQFDDLMILSITNHEDMAHIVGPENMPVFYKLVARRINRLMPTDGALFRAGENQFGILLKKASDDVVQKLADDLKSRLTSKLQVGNSSVYLEFRCGRFDGYINSSDLASNTVDATIASKFYDTNSDHIPVFDTDMRSSIEAKNETVEQIRAAISNKEFIPYYQLKVDSQTTKVTGMEALCRWVKPDGTMINPSEFIDCAENSGLMVDITWLLLEQIAEDYQWWCSAGFNPGRIAFNASESFLLEADFKEQINLFIRKFEYDFCPIDLEVTESVALTNRADKISESISYARKQGMMIALDDFGTGFASLSSVLTLEIDTIKIDKSFVCGLDTNEDSRNVVKSIIQLCKQLNKKCVVEGVETEAEWLFCRKLACDEIQGYLFFKPADAECVMASLMADQQRRDVG